MSVRREGDSVQALRTFSLVTGGCMSPIHLDLSTSNRHDLNDSILLAGIGGSRTQVKMKGLAEVAPAVVSRPRREDKSLGFRHGKPMSTPSRTLQSPESTLPSIESTTRLQQLTPTPNPLSSTMTLILLTRFEATKIGGT